MESFADSRNRHRGDERWENFARRILRSSAIRLRLWRRQEGRCAHCGKPLQPANISVHHLSYEHRCITDRTLRIHGERGLQPPCRDCAAATECQARLQALCHLCHRRLHRPQASK